MTEPRPPLRRYLRSRRIVVGGKEVELPRDDDLRPVVWEVDREQLEHDILETQDRLLEQAEEYEERLAALRTSQARPKQQVIDEFLARENARLRTERDRALALLRQVAAHHPSVAEALKVLSDRADHAWVDDLLPDQ